MNIKGSKTAKGNKGTTDSIAGKKQKSCSSKNNVETIYEDFNAFLQNQKRVREISILTLGIEHLKRRSERSIDLFKG